MSRLIVLVTLLTVVGSLMGQDDPPANPISVIATERCNLGEWIQIHVETTAEKPPLVRVWRVAPGPDTLLETGLLELVGGDFALVSTTGTYRIEAAATVGDRILTAQATAVIGEPLPGPDIPPPTPDDVVVNPGKRWIIVVRETADATPATARLVVDLRKQIDPYAVQHGHRLLILDDDSVDPLGASSPALKPWLDKAVSVGLPSLLIGDSLAPPGKNVLYAGKLPSTAGEVLELVKKHGG